MQKDVARLCAAIQALTSHVTPLTRIMDFIPEDFGAMHKELETWRNETRHNVARLHAEDRSSYCYFLNLLLSGLFGFLLFLILYVHIFHFVVH